jgi:hypothetical protein
MRSRPHQIHALLIHVAIVSRLRKLDASFYFVFIRSKAE